MLKILFGASSFFWSIKMFLKSFSFWDVENIKPKFQPRYAYKLYAYEKEFSLIKDTLNEYSRLELAKKWPGNEFF